MKLLGSAHTLIGVVIGVILYQYLGGKSSPQTSA